MNIRIRLVICIISALVIAGCGSQSLQTDQVKSEISQITEGPIVINVLDETMYNDCHIAGSIQVDFDKIESYVENIAKDVEIIVYCSNYACSTSDFVGKKLQKLGYTNVKVYEGGTAEWKQQGLPTVGPAKGEYLKRVMQKPLKDSESSVPTISMDELAATLHVTRNVQ